METHRTQSKKEIERKKMVKRPDVIFRNKSKEHREKVSLSLKGRSLSVEHKAKLSNAKKGKKSPWSKGRPKGYKVSEETKLKISRGHTGKSKPWARGEKSRFWKGGITPVNMVIRKSLEYKIWRAAVFERDNYTCVWCGTKSGVGKKVVLNADHIKPFALYPELRFALDNGRTLCKPCHMKTNTYMGRAKKYRP